MSVIRISYFYLLLLVSWPILASAEAELLPVEQAYRVSATAVSAEQVIVSWQIAPGTSLYRHKFSFESQTPNIGLGEIVLPNGTQKQDEMLGNVQVLTHVLEVPVPLHNPDQAANLSLKVKYQGCADIGVCYPPQQKVLDIALPVATPANKTNPLAQLSKGLTGLTQGLFQDELLPAEQAFQFFASLKDNNTLHLNWVIADGYYLYREKVNLSLKNAATVQLGNYQIPHGEPKQDQAFGQVEIFHQTLEFDLPLVRPTPEAQTITLVAGFQGCADRGVCYPPMSKEIVLNLPASTQLTPPAPDKAPLSEQDQIIQALHQDTLALTLVSFLGFGLLLSFTPCVFPMIPILSGIIVGHNKIITTRKAFLLSLSYVLASALTYTVFGILAALFGSNLQATFQQPWVIGLFSAVFILLSLSMFGFYELQLPQALQSKLHDSTNKHRNGSYLGAAIMGALSSLIVGPCVAAPLAGALIYIGQTGDVILGGSALFMMGLGMGLPLLAVGASAGKLLPKAGHWLNATKSVFGVIMLAVATWMLDRILPPQLTMLLWAMLLIIPAIYLNALDPLPQFASGWRKFWKGLGLVMLVYGVLLLLGLSLGGTNPLKPLAGLINTGSAMPQKQAGLQFQRIRSVAELDQFLSQANQKQQWVMLDFYADWCISCKEMETYTFTDPQVKQRLANFILLQADVTANNQADKELLKRFNLVGPPAILFFASDKQERGQYRVIGYQDSATFLKGLESARKS